MITRDELEVTVVTKEENLADVDVIERNRDRWALVAIDCANPFYCVGFIARMSAALSSAGLDILAVSTFSRDCVFVKEGDEETAAAVLRGVGFVG